MHQHSDSLGNNQSTSPIAVRPVYHGIAGFVPHSVIEFTLNLLSHVHIHHHDVVDRASLMPAQNTVREMRNSRPATILLKKFEEAAVRLLVTMLD